MSREALELPRSKKVGECKIQAVGSEHSCQGLSQVVVEAVAAAGREGSKVTARSQGLPLIIVDLPITTVH